MKIVVVAANIQFYSTKLSLYGKNSYLPANSTEFYVDIVIISLIAFPLLAYIYRIIMGIFIII